MSDLVSNDLLINHPFGRRALRCTWTLTFAILRLLAEQVDCTFSVLDPTVSPGDVRLSNQDNIGA